MDRRPGRFEHTDVKSDGETRWNDHPLEGVFVERSFAGQMLLVRLALLAAAVGGLEVDAGRGGTSRGGGVSTTSLSLLYTH